MTKEEVPERVFNFKKLNDQVKRHFADMMLVTMNILQIQYNKARGGERASPPGARFEDSSRERVRIASTINNLLGAFDVSDFIILNYVFTATVAILHQRESFSHNQFRRINTLQNEGRY